jgi:acyl carrier protein phosphodiesterase
MNWLAHLYLSEPTPEYRLGNILPDLLRPPQLQALASEILRGVRCHHRIDAYTDSHPIVRRSIERLDRSYRRLGGILIDMFYDHFLAIHWPRYASVPLEEFANEVYDSFHLLKGCIPELVLTRCLQMRDSDLLCSYRSLDGIEAALSRIGTRFREPILLGPGISELERHYENLHSDFAAFFPELANHVRHS